MPQTDERLQERVEELERAGRIMRGRLYWCGDKNCCSSTCADNRKATAAWDKLLAAAPKGEGE